MFVGVMKCDLFIPHSQSLKDKRQVVRQLKDTIRARFNVSVCELEAGTLWQRASLGVACIGDDKKYINGTLSRINDIVRSYHAAELITSEMEIQ